VTHTSLPSSEDELHREVTLLELLDRVLDKGVVLTGDITLSVADVDLVYVGLRVLLSSVEAAQRIGAPQQLIENPGCSISAH